MNNLTENDIALIRGYSLREQQTPDKSKFLDSVGRIVNDFDETILTLRDSKPVFDEDKEQEEEESEPEQEKQ